MGVCVYIYMYIYNKISLHVNNKQNIKACHKWQQTFKTEANKIWISNGNIFN